MIIPPDAVYTSMERIAFATDFKNVEQSTPSQLIGSVLQLFNPELHIVHVSKEPGSALSGQMLAEKEKINTLFNGFNKLFSFIQGEDFYDALDRFVLEKKINVLVTVPKHPSNSSSLFRSSHTKKLAYHSHIPILAAHQ